jgi:hypothetical protein
VVEGEGKYALGGFEGQGLMRFREGRRSSIKSHRQVESLLKLVAFADRSSGMVLEEEDFCLYVARLSISQLDSPCHSA